MKFLIVSDMFSLESWLIDGNEPEIMPAVYEFYNFLGNHCEHTFDAVIAHPSVNKVVEFPNGSKVYIYKLKVPVYYIRKFISLPFLKRKAKNLLKKNLDYTHVYGMTIYANVARELGVEYNLKSIGRLFGSLIWDVLKKGRWLKSKTRFHYQLREIKTPCELTICTEDGTEFDKAINKYSPRSKVHLLYNGVNQKLKEKLSSIPVIKIIDGANEIKFCYIARLTHWKRQDLALDIIAKLKANGLKVSLDIYGKGEEELRIRNRIIKLNLSEEVSIKGSISHAQVSSVLSEYQVAMFLYDASNLGNAMWEAALSGRLILTRDTGKTTNIFNKKNAIIMSDENTDQVVRDILELVNHSFTLAQESRRTIYSLLPNWQDRLEEEMRLISCMNLYE